MLQIYPVAYPIEGLGARGLPDVQRAINKCQHVRGTSIYHQMAQRYLVMILCFKDEIFLGIDLKWSYYQGGQGFLTQYLLTLFDA